MMDWETKILENRQRKQQEKEINEKMEEDRKTAIETNRQKAILFISNVAVPTFEKAKEALESDELKMCASYTKLDGIILPKNWTLD